MADTGEFDLCCSGPLNVSLHRTGMFGFLRRATPAHCLQLSLSSLRVETAARFAEGERLVLDLGVNDLRVEEIRGTVSRVRALPDRHVYDIDVELDGRRARNALHGLRHLSTHVGGRSASPGA